MGKLDGKWWKLWTSHKINCHPSSKNIYVREKPVLGNTLPETNIAPTNGWLEYYFPIGEVYFQGRAALVSGRVDSLPVDDAGSDVFVATKPIGILSSCRLAVFQ